jgi:hypothetical protein
MKPLGMRGLLAIIGIWLASAGMAEAGCVQRFNFCPGCSVDITMNVVSGKACKVNYHARGGVYGQETIVAPKHGRYGTANETATAYLANPGYSGADYFEARLYYELANGKKTFTVLRVHVNVKPTRT